MNSDQALLDTAIAAVKTGDASALHFLYVRYADDMLAYTKEIVERDEDAHEIVNGVFIRLPRKMDAFEPGGLPFETWLARVMRRAALDHLRANRHVPLVSDAIRALPALR